jgi:hypothetical protein
LLIGNSIILASLTIGMTLLVPSTPTLFVAFYVFAFGVSRSFGLSSVTTLAYADVPGVMSSRATSVASIIQQLTLNFGVVLASSVLSLLSNHSHTPSLSAFRDAFIVNGVLMLVPIIGFLSLHPNDGDNVSLRRTTQDAAR